ncbi:MAG: GtrA family protein [Clostridia bacterium]|nr:GtrA family protein [Clostridia bacterium]
MKRKDILQAVKFTLFSISAGLVQVASFAFFHDVLHFSQYWLSYLPSLVLSVLWNFTFNRKFTFHSTSNVGRAMLLVALYYLVFTPLSSWWGQLLSNAGVHDWLVEAINMLINFVTEFLYQKFVVFRDAMDREKDTQES